MTSSLPTIQSSCRRARSPIYAQQLSSVPKTSAGGHLREAATPGRGTSRRGETSGNTGPVRGVSYHYGTHTERRTTAAPAVARHCRRCGAVVRLLCATGHHAGGHALRNDGRTRLCGGCPGVVGIL